MKKALKTLGIFGLGAGVAVGVSHVINQLTKARDFHVPEDYGTCGVGDWPFPFKAPPTGEMDDIPPTQPLGDEVDGDDDPFREEEGDPWEEGEDDGVLDPEEEELDREDSAEDPDETEVDEESVVGDLDEEDSDEEFAEGDPDENRGDHEDADDPDEDSEELPDSEDPEGEGDPFAYGDTSDEEDTIAK